MRCYMLPIQLNQAGLVVSRRLELPPEVRDSVEIFSEQGYNFVVMDRHRLAHRGLNVLEKFHLAGAFLFWHKMASITALARPPTRST